MQTTTIDPAVPQPGEDEDEDRGLRRLLVILLGLLGIVAIGLLVILIILLQGSDNGAVRASSDVAGGYPIDPVRSMTGPKSKPMSKPLAATFDAEGKIWVSDTGNSRVLVLSQKGSVERRIGTTGEGKLTSPYGLAVDDGNKQVYVADWSAGAVFKYTTKGKFISAFPTPEQDLTVFGPQGFSPFDVKLVGNRVVVATNDGLYFFDRRGNVVGRWGLGVRSRLIGGFNFPDSFDVDPKSGRVYVADSLNRRVVALDKDGRVLWVSGQPDVDGKVVGFWQLPRGIVVGPNGNVYVTDTFRFDPTGVGTGHIVVLSPDGKVESLFGRSGPDEASFNFPEKMDNKGKLWVIADREANRVLLFKLRPLPDPKKGELEMFAKSFTRPSGVQVGQKISPTTTAPAATEAPAASTPPTTAKKK